jgi:ferredoxin
MSLPANPRIRSTPVVLTPDLARELIGSAAYIALALRCPCREEHKCQDYPVGFGCLYLGEDARGIAAGGNARKIDREQAMEHVRRACGRGLVHMVRRTGADAKKVLALCSCCPCCCISCKAGDGMPAYIDGIIGLAIARADGDCDACGVCEGACVFKAITIMEDGPEINADRCKGCGLCARACGRGVLDVYRLEAVPYFSEGWDMIPAEAFMDDIMKTIN